MSEPLYGLATVWELVSRRAELTPDAPILLDAYDRVLTCAQLRDDAEAVAAGLYALGIKHGTPVTWQLPSRIEAVIASMALARLGAVQNPVLHLYREREVSAVLNASKAQFFITPGEWKGFDYSAMATELAAAAVSRPTVLDVASLPRGDVASLPPAPTDGTEVRWIYYTSGTTSEPKGVKHTDRTLMSGGQGLAIAVDMDASDVGSIAFPFAHIAGPDYLFMLLQVGFPAIMLEAFVPAEAVALFSRLGATMVGGSTAFYQAYLNEQRKNPATPLIPGLKKISGGGAPKPPELYFQVQAEMKVHLLHGYGMTEIPMIAQGSPHDSDDQLAHSEGKPVHGAEVRIVLEDGTLAPDGVDGEVRVRGPVVCVGYTDPALTAEAFDAESFFRTGDIGHLRSDGHLTLTGRLKDVIIRKGENISAKELEDLLFTHPSVENVAVIGLPDVARGEMVCAVVETTPGQLDLTLEDMIAFFKRHQMMGQKIPERLEVIDRLPRNETLNKILKYKLREMYS